jgi:predicted nucleotidyltransferase
MTRTIIQQPDPVASALFGSARRGVLGILFGHPERSFYLRELVRLTAISPGSLQREVRALTDAGLLIREPRGNQMFYRANTAHPVYADLSGLVTKTMNSVDLLRSALAPLADRIEAVYLFGSVAVGRAKGHSDVDVLVIGEVEYSDVTDALASVEHRLGREVNPLVYTLDEFRRGMAEGRHFPVALRKAPLVRIIGGVSELEDLGR